MLQLLNLVLSIGVLVCWVMVVVKMFQNGKTIAGIFSIILCGFGALLALVYGWMKADEWKIKPLMTAFTICFLANIGVVVATLPAQMQEMQKAMEEAQKKAAQGGAGMQPPVQPAPPPVVIPQPAPAPEPETKEQP